MTYRFGPAAPVTICQLEDEFRQLLDVYRAEAPKRVLEIGTASGGTLYHWLRNAAPGAVVVTVDLPEPEYPLDPAMFNEWAPDGVTCVPIRGDSHADDTHDRVWDYAKFDWLFIDGSHEYEQAAADWNDYAAMCKPGALVVLHDIALARSGVPRLWREIQASGLATVEIRTSPLLDEYGIGVVRLP